MQINNPSAYSVMQRYSCPNCQNLLKNSINNNNFTPSPFVLNNIECKNLTKNHDNKNCSKCGKPRIYNDHNIMCKQCGIRKKDHYTTNHHFKPLKSHYCGDDALNPFDPQIPYDQNIPGYDPLSFKYYPPAGFTPLKI